jgi:hypothetical protein
MSPDPAPFAPARRALRWILGVSLAASGVLLVIAAVAPFGVVPTQALLSLFGLSTGALLADILLGTLRRFPEPTALTFAALAASQAFYYLLVWTRWKMDDALWRLWYVAAVAALSGTHVLALRAAAGARPNFVERATPVCAAASAILFASLALQSRIPPTFGPVFLALVALPALGSVAGTIVIWRRKARQKANRAPMARWARVGLLLASQIGAFLAGVYVGGVLKRTPSPFELLPSALAGLSDAEVEAQVRADLGRLRTVVDGIRQLRERSTEFHQEIRKRRVDEGREYYLPEEDDQIRASFASYLAYRSALLRQVATYAGFEAVHDPNLRARCFTVGFAAAVTAFETALTLIERHGDDPLVRRKLNEGEPLHGIPVGMYDRVVESASHPGNVERCQEMAAYFEDRRGAWREAGVWPAEEFEWLDGRISRGLETVRTHRVSPTRDQIRKLFERVKQDLYSPVYTAQAFVSTWIGDTKIVEQKPLIAHGQIEEIEKELRPGDILLERRNWYLSNAFLPGFWPHAALYVGRIEDLRRLGIEDAPHVRRRLELYLKPAADGKPNTVIESVSEGVVFNSLAHSMHADHVAVLRPRLPEEQIAQAIVRAFSHQGKPYDFEFDFFTSDKLVCTELVYRAFEGMIHFGLVRVMGRDTLPAIEIVRKFSRERSDGNRQLDFVLFLDGIHRQERAVRADEEEFCRSAGREQAFHK